MKQTDTALFGVLDADQQSAAAGSLGVLGVEAIHRRKAPAGSAYPHVVFFTQADVDEYTLKRRAFQTLPYFIDIVDEGLSAQRAQNALARIDVLLTDQGLAVDGFTTMYLRRAYTVERDEEADGITYQHVGAQFRWQVTPDA